MKIYYAEVQSVVTTNPSIIICKLIGADNKTYGGGRNVIMTSPFARNEGNITKGGMTAFPESGDRCLIVQPDNNNALFYMSTVLYSEDRGKDDTVPNPPKDFNMNSLDPFKHSWSIQDNVGGIIEFRDSANDKDTNTFVQLRSNPSTFSMNRKVNHESIYTRVDQGETHSLLTGPDNTTSVNGSGFYRTQAQNNMEHVTLYGNLKVQAESEARKIKIINYGSPLVASEDKKSGDIDIESFHNTVNIRGGVSTANAAGKVGVFVQAGIGSGGNEIGALVGKSIIQLNSAGKIQIIAGTPGLDIYSKGPIKMKSDSEIKIQGSRIDLNPNAPVSVTPQKNNLSDKVEEANQNTGGLVTGGTDFGGDQEQ